MAKKGKAIYINDSVLNLLIQAGIDPRTGLPLKAGATTGCRLKDAIKTQLKLIDKQDAVNRITWNDLPLDMSSQDLERWLYYKGSLCFFYYKALGKFMVMPFALDGGIDFYGRFVTVHPVPFAQGTTKKEQALSKAQADILSTLKLKVLYDVPTEPLDEDLSNYCVIIGDYTKQLSETLIPRSAIQDGLLDVMADCIPFMRTALLNSTGVQGMRVGSVDEQSNVQAANKSVDHAALNGEKWIAIEGVTEFQDLTGGVTSKGEEFLMAMQSLDNFRLSTYGLENGGLFEKKQYQNEAQTMLNGSGQVGRPLQDSLSCRQFACDIINAVWGVGVSCELTETAAGMDLNNDGLAATDENSEDYEDSGFSGGEEGGSENGGDL